MLVGEQGGQGVKTSHGLAEARVSAALTVYMLIVLLRGPCTLRHVVRAGARHECREALAPLVARVHHASRDEDQMAEDDT